MTNLCKKSKWSRERKKLTSYKESYQVGREKQNSYLKGLQKPCNRYIIAPCLFRKSTIWDLYELTRKQTTTVNPREGNLIRSTTTRRKSKTSTSKLNSPQGILNTFKFLLRNWRRTTYYIELSYLRKIQRYKHSSFTPTGQTAFMLEADPNYNPLLLNPSAKIHIISYMCGNIGY